MRSILAGVAGTLMAMVCAQGGLAHDDEQENKGPFPRLTVEGYIESRFDDGPQSGDPDAERFDLNPKGEADFDLLFDENFSVHAHVTGESVRSPQPGRDRYVRGTGAYLQELYLKYETGSFALYGGKFGPHFGIGWDRLPDLLKDGFSGDYETTEMNGLGGTLKFAPEGLGKHELNAAAFFSDTTFLHYSLFTSPDGNDPRAERISHLRRGDGGLGNTGKPNNFAVALDGGEFDAMPGLFYHLGYRMLSRGVSESRDEHAVVAALGYEIAMAGEAKLTPFVEYAHFWNFTGARGDADIVTLGLLATSGPWELALSGAWRPVDLPGHASDHDDYVAAFQAAYNFDCGLYVGAGYRHDRLEGVSSDTVRGFVGYRFDWSVALGGD